MEIYRMILQIKSLKTLLKIKKRRNQILKILMKLNNKKVKKYSKIFFTIMDFRFK